MEVIAEIKPVVGERKPEKEEETSDEYKTDLEKYGLDEEVLNKKAKHAQRKEPTKTMKIILGIIGIILSIMITIISTTLSASFPSAGFLFEIINYVITTGIFLSGIVFWLAFGNKGKALYVSLGMIFGTIIIVILATIANMIIYYSTA
jgi:hypothetical protein